MAVIDDPAPQHYQRRVRSLLALALLMITFAGADAGTHLRKPRHGFQMSVGKFTIPPGQEMEVCEYRRLPNRKPMDVNAFALQMPPEGHHFVIWDYLGNITDDRRFPRGSVVTPLCAGVTPDNTIPGVLIPIQSPDSSLHFPQGIAVRLEPHKQVFLNSHLRNFTGKPLTPKVRFNFYRARKGSVKHYAQGLILANITDIHIPAGGDQTLTVEWTAPVNVTVIEMSTHQHKLGTYANIQLGSADGTQFDTIYENEDWLHPLAYWPREPIRLEKGRKVRFTCRWHNTESHLVGFGPKTTDEMCGVVGFYYRDDGDAEPVTGSECIPSKSGLLCIFAPAVGH